MVSSYMSIMHLSYGTVNNRTQLRLQVLGQSFFSKYCHRDYLSPEVSVKMFWNTSRMSCRGFLITCQLSIIRLYPHQL